MQAHRKVVLLPPRQGRVDEWSHLGREGRGCVGSRDQRVDLTRDERLPARRQALIAGEQGVVAVGGGRWLSAVAVLDSHP